MEQRASQAGGTRRAGRRYTSWILGLRGASDEAENTYRHTNTQTDKQTDREIIKPWFMAYRLNNAMLERERERERERCLIKKRKL